MKKIKKHIIKILAAIMLLGVVQSAQATIQILSSAQSSATDCTGTVEIQAQGTAGPFTLKIEGSTVQMVSGINGTYTFTGLCVENYQIYVTDAYGCEKAFEVDIAKCEADIKWEGAYVDEYPSDCNDNSISSNGGPTGGLAPYTFAWSDLCETGYIHHIFEMPRGLCPGNYTVTITDDNGCTGTRSFDITGGVFLEIDENRSSCSGENNGELSMVAGLWDDGNHLFEWSQTGVTGTHTLEGSGLEDYVLEDLAPGEYCVTLTDVNNTSCSLSECYTVGTIPSLELDYEVITSCADVASGSITLNASGGLQPYYYVWSGGTESANANTIDNLEEGDYSVTISDYCRQELVQTFEVRSNATINAEIITTINSCTANLNAEVSGGEAPYQIIWNTGDITESLSYVSSGQYEITATDAIGCTATVMEEVTAGFEISIVSVINVSEGEYVNAGSIDIDISSANMPLIFEWTGPNDFTANTEDISDLEPGIYVVTVTDSYGCRRVTSIEVGDCGFDPPILNVNLSIVQEISGIGLADGKLHTSFSNGVGTITFHWTGPNGFYSESTTIDQLSDGRYCVVAEDGCGEKYTSCITLCEPMSIYAPIVDNGCSNEDGGFIGTSISINSVQGIQVTGGQGPYTYEWDNELTTSFNHLAHDGDNCVTVTDALGCTKIECYYLASSSTELTEELAGVYDLGGVLGCVTDFYCGDRYAGFEIDPIEVIAIAGTEDSGTCSYQIFCGDEEIDGGEGVMYEVPGSNECTEVQICDTDFNLYNGFIDLVEVFSGESTTTTFGCERINGQDVCVKRIFCENLLLSQSVVSDCECISTCNCDIAGPPERPPFRSTPNDDVKKNLPYDDADNISNLIAKKKLINYPENRSAANNSIKAYPNPFNNKLNVTFSVQKAEQISLKIIDLLGNEWHNIDINAESTGLHTETISMRTIPVGVYYVQVINEAGIIGVEKVISSK